MINHISFPGPGFDLEINRIAFELFGRPIYWYAIIIATGFLLAVFYGMHRSREFDLTDDHITGMLMFAVPLAIICARAYYVIFNFDLYRSNPVRMFYIWEGGIAIYGAILGALLGAFIYCRIKHTSIVRFLDIGALGLLIGQSIGRWGNFVNAEAHGAETDLFWRMEINGGVGVHPTFLYESLWNAVGFVILHFWSKKLRFRGEVFWLYVLWYGVGRAIIEGMRTDSLYLFGTGLRVSQLLAIASAFFAAIVLVYNYKKIKTEVNTNECSDN
ncbi:MAG: prolipoprotein diacylglyceryl transferase [Oscillospiraceae bacterium]|nr:prolipoprotein diacylglyceryl transferase [Oscillospiraceae bacterium]